MKKKEFQVSSTGWTGEKNQNVHQGGIQEEDWSVISTYQQSHELPEPGPGLEKNKPQLSRAPKIQGTTQSQSLPKYTHVDCAARNARRK